MTDLREAAKQALEYLEAPSAKLWPAGTLHNITNALRAALAQPAASEEPLFLLHCGQIDSGGEQDDWETEADSGQRVDEFARQYPGKTVPLYAHPSLAQPSGEPVAWREHVEQRIRGWRQSTMNRSGDRLALDDMMCQDSIEDLIDYVCDEWAVLAAPQPAPAQARQPLTGVELTQIELRLRVYCDYDKYDLSLHDFARAIEAAHGIKAPTGEGDR